MIGVDTNVLVRFLVRDDEEQFAAAYGLFSHFKPDKPGFISIIALVETIWVLHGKYQNTMAEIAEVLRRLLESEALRFEHADAIQSVLKQSRSGAGLADALIVRCGLNLGCVYTYTFDKRAAKLPYARLLKSTQEHKS
jgi:predicted nucleic-acid-binding protein